MDIQDIDELRKLNEIGIIIIATSPTHSIFNYYVILLYPEPTYAMRHDDMIFIK